VMIYALCVLSTPNRLWIWKADWPTLNAPRRIRLAHPSTQSKGGVFLFCLPCSLFSALSSVILFSGLHFAGVRSCAALSELDDEMASSDAEGGHRIDGGWASLPIAKGIPGRLSRRHPFTIKTNP
jgi:hypothetical protein